MPDANAPTPPLDLDALEAEHCACIGVPCETLALVARVRALEAEVAALRAQLR